MKIFKVGDRGRGMCDKCESLIDTTYSLRDVPFSDGSGIVKNILVGICNHCDSIVSMPYQSTPVIKTQLDKQRISFESRIPAHMIDILNLASFELGGNTDFVSSIMKYYIHALSIEELSAKDMAKYLESNLAKGKAQKRFSIKGKNIADDIYKLKKITNIDSTSDLIKIIILRIYDDILMKKNPEPIKFLKSLVAISC